MDVRWMWAKQASEISCSTREINFIFPSIHVLFCLLYKKNKTSHIIPQKSTHVRLLWWCSSSYFYSEKYLSSQAGLEPTTFRSPVIPSNYWANPQPTFSHLSSNSSMVRASHRWSEGCGFASRLGTQIFFWVKIARRTSS